MFVFVLHSTGSETQTPSKGRSWNLWRLLLKIQSLWSLFATNQEIIVQFFEKNWIKKEEVAGFFSFYLHVNI